MKNSINLSENYVMNKYQERHNFTSSEKIKNLKL